VKGPGPNGRIVSTDVKKYVEESKTQAKKPAEPAVEKKPTAPKPKPVSIPAGGQVVPLTNIQKIVAERLTMSYQTAPHINIQLDVNCEKMMEIRNILKAQGLKVSYNDILAKFTAVVLKEFPRFNSVYEDDGVHLLEDINIGIAVAAGDDLVVPVVKNVDQRDIAVIANESARLIAAAREGKLMPDDISGGTLTITNLGMFGVRTFSPIINPPQVAILAVGSIEPRAVVIPGQIIAQHMMTLSLSIDHRVVNGAHGGQFLSRLKELVETASMEVLMNRL
ncbi:2-oxo acid dehydrogenase subunit E2, partial [Candidatus Poribacteria bacterium]|nr:2-oxo acid dehydrogenase subunit E2 [Candidatus Poribacteria bacterium]